MNFAVGIDLQPIDEVEDSLRTFGERYTRLLYTNAELKGRSSDPHLAARDLATIFATKEAVMKVLAPSDDIPSWLDIEVRHVIECSPSIVLSGVAAELALRQGVTDVAVSFGCTRECATATAVAQRSNSGVTQSR
jgi:holo-[acyl-carrier protein] synthase